MRRMQRGAQEIDSQWELAGYAFLCRDDKTGQPYWRTYNGDGTDICDLSMRQPIVLPTKKLPLSSLVRIYVPKDKSNE